MGLCCCFGSEQDEEIPKKRSSKSKGEKSKRRSERSVTSEKSSLLKKEKERRRQSSRESGNTSNGNMSKGAKPPMPLKQEVAEKEPEYGLGESADSNSQLWDAVAAQHEKRVSVVCDLNRSDSTLYESEPKKIPLRYSHASYNVPSSPPTYKRRDSTVWEDMQRARVSPVQERRKDKRTYSSDEDGEGHITFQSPYLAFPPPPDDVKSGDEDDQAYKSLLHFLKKEFIEVEESYVNALKTVIKEYMQPLLLNQALAENIKELVGALYNIKACNVIFLQDMKEAVAKQSSPTDPLPYASVNIGTACVNHMRTFRTLASYAALYENFIKYTQSLKDDVKEDYVDFITKTQERLESNHENKDLSIKSLLVWPIQMLAKYRTILQRLLDSTKSSDPEFSSLQQAVTEATGVCNYCNKRWTEHDEEQKVPAIEARWGIKGLVKTGRYCMMQCEMEKLTLKSKTPVKCYVYLFNDMLLVITFKKNVSETDKGKKIFSLSLADRLDISPEVDDKLLRACGVKEPLQNTLSIAADGYTLAFILPTTTAKNLWYETIRDVRAATLRRMKMQRHRSTIGIDLHDD
eukprot:TRINITY_DN12076_c0_g1_i1.p1 TRINITY_DN12076_c0_g1~~TRINITY_DN12076_c0_g1_i1.p1  ORF type:complete len:575 (+),score=224.74 TRINITY_DN12076_c0_g1_i1:33-1757(+)